MQDSGHFVGTFLLPAFHKNNWGGSTFFQSTGIFQFRVTMDFWRRLAH